MSAKCPHCGVGILDEPLTIRTTGMCGGCGTYLYCTTFCPELAKAEAENERLRKIVDLLPVKRLLRACAIIDRADNPTEANMTPGELQACLSALWACKDVAESAASEVGKEQDNG